METVSGMSPISLPHSPPELSLDSLNDLLHRNQFFFLLASIHNPKLTGQVGDFVKTFILELMDTFVFTIFVVRDILISIFILKG